MAARLAVAIGGAPQRGTQHDELGPQVAAVPDPVPPAAATAVAAQADRRWPGGIPPFLYSLRVRSAITGGTLSQLALSREAGNVMLNSVSTKPGGDQRNASGCHVLSRERGSVRTWSSFRCKHGELDGLANQTMRFAVSGLLGAVPCHTARMQVPSSDITACLACQPAYARCEGEEAGGEGGSAERLPRQPWERHRGQARSPHLTLLRSRVPVGLTLMLTGSSMLYGTSKNPIRVCPTDLARPCARPPPRHRPTFHHPSD